MGFPEDYAKEVFEILDRRRSKNAHTNFLKAFKKICKEKDKKNESNDVGCSISIDCSSKGCYRYICCDFPQKKVKNNIK